jgi:hypothetical protein
MALSSSISWGEEAGDGQGVSTGEENALIVMYGQAAPSLLLDVIYFVFVLLMDFFWYIIWPLDWVILVGSKGK